MTYPINIIDFYYFSHDPIGPAGGFNTYNYVDNPNNWVDPMGLDALDVLTIVQTIDETIANMTVKGLRMNPTPLFNINNHFSGHLDCGGQTDYTIGVLDKLKRSLNDTWEFSLRSGFGHAWGVARSSNPSDPIIWFDPRASIYSIGSPCETCHGWAGFAWDKFRGYDIEPPPSPKSLPPNWR